MSSTKKSARRGEQGKIDPTLFDMDPSAATMAEELEDEASMLSPPSTDDDTEPGDDTEDRENSVASNPDEMEEDVQKEREVEAEESSQNEEGTEASPTDLQAFLDFKNEVEHCHQDVLICD